MVSEIEITDEMVRAALNALAGKYGGCPGLTPSDTCDDTQCACMAEMRAALTAAAQMIAEQALIRAVEAKEVFHIGKVHALVKLAVAKERERCARAAERHIQPEVTEAQATRDIAVQAASLMADKVAAAIAAEIRTGAVAREEAEHDNAARQ